MSDSLRERRPLWAALFTALSWLLLVGCATPSDPLRAVERVDVDRFMGDWYVIAHIPLALERNAYNAVESYARGEGDAIQTVYRFRDGGFDGELEVYRPKGWIADTGSGAEWRMQFLWPFRSAYLIAWVDDDYRETIVGVPDRDYAWIMTREPDVSEARYEALVARLSSLGYDPARLRRVPHRWPEAPAGARR